jgi:hypothetical protein
MGLFANVTESVGTGSSIVHFSLDVLMLKVARTSTCGGSGVGLGGGFLVCAPTEITASATAARTAQKDRRKPVMDFLLPVGAEEYRN